MNDRMKENERGFVFEDFFANILIYYTCLQYYIFL